MVSPENRVEAEESLENEIFRAFARVILGVIKIRIHYTRFTKIYPQLLSLLPFYCDFPVLLPPAGCRILW